MSEPQAEGAPALDTGLLPAGGKDLTELLDGAEACFRRAGYAGTSIREIAREAGVSKGLIHYHFQSKEHLFLEVQARFYRRVARGIADSLADRDGPQEQALFALDEVFRAFQTSADLQVQAKVWAASLSNQTLLGHVQRMRNHLRTELVKLVAKVLGPARSAFPISPEAAVDLLWGTFVGLGLQASIDDEDRTLQAFAALRQLVAQSLSSSPLWGGGPAQPGTPTSIRQVGTGSEE